jgi:hypothetical protein
MSASVSLLNVETELVPQAAQATFRSIKSVIPLLDRVLVQRFKPETVCLHKTGSYPLSVCLLLNRKLLRVSSSPVLPLAALYLKPPSSLLVPVLMTRVAK